MIAAQSWIDNREQRCILRILWDIAVWVQPSLLQAVHWSYKKLCRALCTCCSRLLAPGGSVKKMCGITGLWATLVWVCAVMCPFAELSLRKILHLEDWVHDSQLEKGACPLWITMELKGRLVWHLGDRDTVSERRQSYRFTSCGQWPKEWYWR